MADRFGTRRVFASAIGLFTLGSLLCGLSTNLHELVACRILQGCGGAMMVPVGRLTLVRTFAKFELIRAMSFVAIPALVGPMLGPIAGGLIVGYLHWRVIFFVNLPIGLLGLILVYLHLPDYREKLIRSTSSAWSCLARALACCPMCWKYSASTLSTCAKSPVCSLFLFCFWLDTVFMRPGPHSRC
jgi:MFS family permease